MRMSDFDLFELLSGQPMPFITEDDEQVLDLLMAENEQMWQNSGGEL